MSFLSQLDAVLDRYAHLAEQDFNSTERSWETHKESFKIDAYAYGRKVYTTNDVMYWLNYGTDVRHAKLSKDWVSKTAVRSLSSGGGNGKVLFVSSRYKAKGITARLWDEVIQEKYMAEFVAEMQKIAEESVVL